MTGPGGLPVLRDVLQRIVDHAPAVNDAVVDEILELVRRIYAMGRVDALHGLSAQLTADQAAGVPLTEQRLVAALAASKAGADRNMPAYLQ